MEVQETETVERGGGPLLPNWTGAVLRSPNFVNPNRLIPLSIYGKEYDL